MPYRIAKSGTCPVSRPWAVVNAETGRVMGCHASRADAQKQLGALYTNEPGLTEKRRKREG